MALRNSLCFDIVGSLITSQGYIPTFLRHSTANTETITNDSVRTNAVAIHQPRITTTGSLVMEKGSINLCSHPQNLVDSSWVKGGNILIQTDKIEDPQGNYLADRVSVSSYTGNQNANTMTKTFVFGSGQTFSVSAYLRLANGRFGGNDVLRVTGDVAAVTSISLGSVFNANAGNYVKVPLVFTTAGTKANESVGIGAGDLQRTVTLQLYVENAVSIDWGSIQVEPGEIATSLISNQQGLIESRAKDFLQYGRSPIEGLSSFVFYCNLEGWRGDGNILTAGNFKVSILGGALTVVTGAITTTDPGMLPSNAKIAVRVSQGLGRVSIYVNQVMKAFSALTSYSASSAVVQIFGDGFRRTRCLYFFNKDLGDGSIDVNGSVLGEILELHQQDSLLSDLAEGFSRIILPSVQVKAGETITVRYPQIQFASQLVSSLSVGSGKVAQVETIRVETISNASASQIDAVIINEQWFSFTSDATPTKAEIAAGLSALVSASSQPVTVAYTATNDFFTLTSTVAGDDFFTSTSRRLSRTTTTPNSVDSNSIVVVNASDFIRGTVQIFNNYAFVIEASITAINTGTNTLTVSCTPNSSFTKIQPGNFIVQPLFTLRVGANNSICHHLQDFSEIKLEAKSLDGFSLKNVGLIDRVVTPYAKLTI